MMIRMGMSEAKLGARISDCNVGSYRAVTAGATQSDELRGLAKHAIRDDAARGSVSHSRMQSRHSSHAVLRAGLPAPACQGWVGARRGQAAWPARGGGYLGTCTTSNFSRAEAARR